MDKMDIQNGWMDIQAQSNFIMLTERLYTLFRRYILSGRIRAPPEFELSDLIPTFQQGARTNRRALQSKFKSWARRMEIRNGNLILSSSGKLIIPREKCDELVMVLHSDDHLHVDSVINKIQLKYTWSKKNFGMDRETVMKCIVMNCKNAECRSGIKRDLTGRNYSKIIFKGSSLSHLPTGFFQDTNGLNPLVFSSTRSSNWPLKFPSRSNFSYTAPQNIFSIKNMPDYKCTKSPHFADCLQHSNARTLNWSKTSKKFFSQQPKQTEIIQTDEYQPVTCTPKKNSKYIRNRVLKKHGSTRKSCRKLRNIHDFRAMLKATEHQAGMHPAVLTDPKTKFLSTFGLVPTKICNKKTLKKFKKELCKKHLIEKQLWKYGYKILRDRNKMHKKSTYSQKNVPCLHQDMRGSIKSYIRCIPKEKLKMSPRYVKDNELSSAFPTISAKSDPEVIDISSDDEGNFCQVIKVTKNDEKTNKANFDKLNNLNQWINMPLVLRTNQTSQFFGPNSGMENETFNLPPREKIATLQNMENSFEKNVPEELFSKTDNNVSEQKEQELSYPIVRPYLIPVGSAGGVAIVHTPFYPMIRSFGSSNTLTDEMNCPFRTINNPKVKNVKSLNLQGLKPMVFQPVPILPRPNIPPSTAPSKENDRNSTAADRVHRMPPDVKVFMMERNPKGPVFLVPPRHPMFSQTIRTHTANQKVKQPIAPRTKGPPTDVFKSELDSPGSSNRQQVQSRESIDNKSKEKDSVKTDIDLEMKKLSNWISRMKSYVTPTLFRRGVEKPVQRLITQLNIGIHLVRDVRKALIEVENYEKERNGNMALAENRSGEALIDA